MNDNWLKDIHDKMSDFETDAPQGLWNDIILAQQGVGNINKQNEKKRKSIFSWRRLLTAAAIAAVVVTIGSMLLIKNLSNSSNSESKVNLLADKVHKETPSLPSTKANLESHETFAGKKSAPDKVVIHSGMHANNQEPYEAFETEEICETRPSQETVPSKKNDHNTAAPIKSDIFNNKENKTCNRNLIALNNVTNRNDGEVSIGIFSTGGTGAELNRKSTAATALSGIGSGNSNWKDTPVLGLLTFNRGKEIKNDVKHHLPIKAGISFLYALNNRFGISSGITYSNLTSDIFQGSENHYFTGKQTLHYIGIPVNLKLNIISWNNFDVYASTGVMGEKCVSGSLDKTYVLDDKIADKARQSINEKPFQWSVNASAGLQFNISSFFGIYAEPGVSYYFDDGSNLKTVYKEKPVNFNLNLGLRFTIGD